MNCAKDGIGVKNLKIHVLRSLVMNIVQSMLRIGFDLRVDTSVPLEPTYREAAKRRLQQVHENLFEGIEQRRRMIYNLCMARAYDDEADGRFFRYLVEARYAGEDGAFFLTDIQNINAYHDFLKKKKRHDKMKIVLLEIVDIVCVFVCVCVCVRVYKFLALTFPPF
ncbi:hypothetical protein MAR_011065 [Mya arenaria]|uniref:Uncharacterized protein n=1 Tax=Mya arenaria TaxID=6604 RepID=A0ABY7G203_MYAAR|nr:hypothetical protein MAR_011065 [Mya arenaria]